MYRDTEWRAIHGEARTSLTTVSTTRSGSWEARSVKSIEVAGSLFEFHGAQGTNRLRRTTAMDRSGSLRSLDTLLLKEECFFIWMPRAGSCAKFGFPRF